jgi:hypothetical protein
MSYMAETLMKQNMSPEEYSRNVNGPPPQQDAAAPDATPIAEAPAGPIQAQAQSNTAEGDANIEKERQRFRTAGYDAESRLLGGPQGKLGG